MSARSAVSGTRSGSASAAASASLARVSDSAECTSDDDIDASLVLHHLVALELEARVGGAFAGEQLVFPAVPGADDMRVAMIVGLAEISLVGAQQLDHLALDHALAGRAALMQAVVAVGVEGAGVPVDADFEPVLTDDADIAIAHVHIVTNENLRHSSPAPCWSSDLQGHSKACRGPLKSGHGSDSFKWHRLLVGEPGIPVAALARSWQPCRHGRNQRTDGAFVECRPGRPRLGPGSAET